MFSATTKDAIKVSLSIVITICLSLWIGWEKPYWAAIATAVVALTENVGSSIHKGRNRLIGTAMGIAYAFFLIAMFPQDPFLFFTFMTLFLGVCVFMSTDPEYGYIFLMAFTVCMIIAAMGGLDSATTFNFAILRTQQTILGLIVYSLVSKLLWPIKVGHQFYPMVEDIRNQLLTALETKDNATRQKMSETLAPLIAKLQSQLRMPLGDSYSLSQHKHAWKVRLQEFEMLNSWISIESDATIFSEEMQQHKTRLAAFDVDYPQHSLLVNAEHRALAFQHRNWKPQYRSFAQHLHDDYPKVLQGVVIFCTAIFLWVYIPIPGGVIFPMLGGTIAVNLPVMPATALRDVILSIIGFGTVVLAEYVFIMPTFTQVWQLAIFYFVNIFVIWKLFAKPNLMIFRILGTNLVLVLTAGALHLTPVYSIETPLLMILNLLIVSFSGKLFFDLFHATTRAR
ncbi:FUSC family protein [Vibrio pacinii]|uniref:FUSC family protein n=1 Tax=Vibrio pacinii TaxID=170674 RepID=UPI00056E3CE3|nr:FUSC family protein [Vibrio pacinii]